MWDKTLAAVRDELNAELDDGTSLFWSNVDEQGEKKDVGWDFLNAHSDHEDDGDRVPSQEEKKGMLRSGERRRNR